MRETKDIRIATGLDTACSTCGKTLPPGTWAKWIRTEDGSKIARSKIVCLDCVKDSLPSEEKMSFEDRIRNNYYKSKLQYPMDHKDPDYKAKREAYRQDESRLSTEFQTDLYDDLGITGHPKADLLFSKAYDRGHSGGMYEVYLAACDLVDLIQD